MKVAIIDCDSVAFSIFNGNKVLDSEGNPVKVLSEAGNMVFQYTDKTEEELKQSADEVLHSILRKGGFTHYLGFIKGVNTIQYKLNVNPLYKQNRNKESPKFWNFVKNYLILKWNIIEVNDIEVDDAVNIARLNIPNSYIVAIDSDLLALEGTHYNWRKNEWCINNKSDFELKFWTDVITGTHNNTKGIPGKGKKYVEKRLKYDPLIDIEFNEFCRYRVFSDYIKHFGERKGIEEFYSNYICCSILTNHEVFEKRLKELYKPIIYE